MREILFKARRLDNGKWVEGYYLDINQRNGHTPTYYILEAGASGFDFWWHKVDPATVCQYTGLTDKNGVKVFEGDEVTVFRGWRGTRTCTVSFGYGAYVLEDELVRYPLFGIENQIVVTGNIHDEREE